MINESHVHGANIFLYFFFLSFWRLCGLYVSMFSVKYYPLYLKDLGFVSVMFSKVLLTFSFTANTVVLIAKMCNMKASKAVLSNSWPGAISSPRTLHTVHSSSKYCIWLFDSEIKGVLLTLHYSIWTIFIEFWIMCCCFFALIMWGRVNAGYNDRLFVFNITFCVSFGLFLLVWMFVCQVAQPCNHTCLFLPVASVPAWP